MSYGNNRGHMPAFNYFPKTTVSSDLTMTALFIGEDCLSGLSFHQIFNKDTTTAQTLAGTLVIEASNDPRGRGDHPDHASADWVDVTALVTPTNPTAGAGNGMDVFINARFEFIRLRLSGVSGSGDYTVFFSGHADG